MNCCVNCFNDTQIRKIIASGGHVGKCDFCGAENIYVSDISVPNPISELIVQLVQAYEVSDTESAVPLKDALAKDWDIFAGDIDQIDKLIKVLCKDIIDISGNLFSQKVVIPQLYAEDYLHENGVVSGHKWSEFCNYIKYSNRFHNSYFNSDVFSSLLSLSVIHYSEAEQFLRGRKSDSKKGHTCDEMYCPPPGKRTAGRINPEGIGVLYLAKSISTVLAETRPYIYDYLTIGTFKPLRLLRVVDLSGLERLSPFLYEGDIARFAVNRTLLKEMCTEIAKPLRSTASSFEYLPTQFIAEFVKSQNYDGVQYNSTVDQGGKNIALFDEKTVECTNVQTIEVTQITHSYQPIEA